MVIMASATTTAATDATEVCVVIIILECGNCMVVDGNRVGWALGFCSEGHERTYVFSTLSGSPLSII